MTTEMTITWNISPVTLHLSRKAGELYKAIKTACNLESEDESTLSNLSYYLVTTNAVYPPSNATSSVHRLAEFLETWKSLEPAEIWRFYQEDLPLNLNRAWGEAFSKAQELFDSDA